MSAPSNVPDAETLGAILKVQKEAKGYVDGMQQEHLHQFKLHGQLRKFFAPGVGLLVALYLVFSSSVLCCSGLSLPTLKNWYQFQLSDTVLVALITGASANVIGLLIVVLTNLFPRRDKPD